MCVEGSQAIVPLRGALKRGFLAKKGHLKRLRPPATACDGGHPHSPNLRLSNLHVTQANQPPHKGPHEGAGTEAPTS